MASPLTRDTLRQHLQRWLRRIRAFVWRPARILLPAPQPAITPPHTDFDFCPWLFWREATPAEQKAQLDYQALLKNTGQIKIGARCFISTLAGLVPTYLSLGDDSYVGAYAYITDEVEMGSHCTLNPYAIVRGKVKLGEGVRVGSQTSILGFDHQYGDPDRPIYQQGLSYQGITIGDDVWLGASVVVTDGVTIGGHTVVGAGAIVTHDIPPYSVAVGNPARVVRSRRAGAASSSLQSNLKNFGERVAAEWPEIVRRSYQADGAEAKLVDYPGAAPTVRAWCDAVEIASLFGALPEPFSKTALVERLQSFQEAETGLLPSPYGKQPSQSDLWRLRDFTSRYNILAVGYALELLGTRFRYPILAVEKLAGQDLTSRLKGLPWARHAWNAGDWVDCLGTGLYFNLKQFSASQSPEPLLGWLTVHADKLSGVWGRPTPGESWLQPVNGFYRITRGTFAQFGVPVPYPEAVIDTMLAHSRDSRFFNDKLGTACNVLDVAHPLWLCGLQTRYRRAEVEQWAAGQAQLALDRWRPRQGFSFRIRADDPASLKGTEMWLSIVYLLAELCGESMALGYRPWGVHRLEPAWVLPAV